eukprot:COSAG02_NODE_2636_length_8361_cov_6.129993_3_plen_210_part_00
MKLKDLPSTKTPATYKRAKNPERQLRYAAWEGNLNEVKKIASCKGVDVDTVDGDGFSPLLIAARWNRLDVAKVLLETFQVDITLRTREGDSAYNLAEIHGHTEMVAYLASKGCSRSPNVLREERSASAETWLQAALPQMVCSRSLTFGRRSSSTLPSGMLESPASPPSSPLCTEPAPEPERETEPEPEHQLAEGVPPVVVWKCGAHSDD